MRKVEVPTDSVPEFELVDSATDMQQRRQDRGEHREGGGKATAMDGGDQEGGGKGGGKTLTRGGNCRTETQDREKGQRMEERHEIHSQNKGRGT